MKLGLIMLAIALLLTVITEIGLRLLLGFGNPPLYQGDPTIGYLLVPNQQLKRFGNRIIVNQYSMRHQDIQPQPTANTWRILMIGDSIINGGWWTDQDQTISTLLKQELTPIHQDSMEVLNASANSWGPRNQLAYLERFGTFGAKTIILLMNTDDFFATAPTDIPVGKLKTYPTRKPLLALQELLYRLLPDPELPEFKAIQAEPGDRVGFNLAAIEQINQICLAHDCQFILALTPLLRETAASGPKDYELKARTRLEELVTQKKFTFIDFLPIFEQQPEPPASFYRDHIHLSSSGNLLVTRTLSKTIKELAYHL